VAEKYYINREERRLYNQEEISYNEYFSRNKWWLRQAFKKEKMNGGTKNQFGSRYII
jgi:hypothetical protein